jgi:hypothetical protein
MMLDRGEAKGQPPNPLIVKAIGTSTGHENAFAPDPFGVRFHTDRLQMGSWMPKVRQPIANMSDTRKILHGIHRLEERISRMERAQAAGGLAINDSATQGSRRDPWVQQLRARK